VAFYRFLAVFGVIEELGAKRAINENHQTEIFNFKVFNFTSKSLNVLFKNPFYAERAKNPYFPFCTQLLNSIISRELYELET
jgi:hypothetical protein